MTSLVDGVVDLVVDQHVALLESRFAGFLDLLIGIAAPTRRAAKGSEGHDAVRRVQPGARGRRGTRRADQEPGSISAVGTKRAAASGMKVSEISSEQATARQMVSATAPM